MKSALETIQRDVILHGDHVEITHESPIKYERHYSDGSKEVIDGEDCANYISNIDLASSVCCSRFYVNFKPVNWKYVDNFMEKQRIRMENSNLVYWFMIHSFFVYAIVDIICDYIIK